MNNGVQIVYTTDVDMYDWLQSHPNTVVFHYSVYMNAILKLIPDDSCHKFQVIPLADWPGAWMAVALNPQMEDEVFEQLNSEITARSEWMQTEYQKQTKNISDECWENYFPTIEADKLNVEYKPLNFQAISG